MRVAVAFEGRLPSPQADSEALVNSAAALARRGHRVVILHASNRSGANDSEAIREYYGTADAEFAGLRNPFRQRTARHAFQALRIPSTREYATADVIYTRNLAILASSLNRGAPVLFDHYRPYPDQRPGLQPLLRAWMTHPDFLGIACHSELAARSFRRIGITADRVRVVRNGFEPRLMEPALPKTEARARLGLDPARPIVTYAGRINERKGLDVLLAAAVRLPDAGFLLVGSAGEENEIERSCREIPNVRLVPWQRPEAVAPYLYASDVVVIPPSAEPLDTFGRTVLPLKAYLYLASGRPIVAGDTPDVGEVLEDDVNALLVAPGDVEGTAGAIARLLDDPERADRLSRRAREDSRRYTWDARAERLEAFMAERLAVPRVRSVDPGWTFVGWMRECLGLRGPSRVRAREGARGRGDRVTTARSARR